MLRPLFKELTPKKETALEDREIERNTSNVGKKKKKPYKNGIVGGKMWVKNGARSNTGGGNAKVLGNSNKIQEESGEEEEEEAGGGGVGKSSSILIRDV